MSSERVQRWVLLCLLLVANLYMEFFKELALRSAPAKPHLWKRCVNETCCTLKKDTVDGLLDHHPSGSLLRWRRMEACPFSTLCSRGERMAAWMSPSTGSPHTLTNTWTSDPTIHLMIMSRGDWSSACMTE